MSVTLGLRCCIIWTRCCKIYRVYGIFIWRKCERPDNARYKCKWQQKEKEGWEETLAEARVTNERDGNVNVGQQSELSEKNVSWKRWFWFAKAVVLLWHRIDRSCAREFEYIYNRCVEIAALLIEVIYRQALACSEFWKIFFYFSVLNLPYDQFIKIKIQHIVEPSFFQNGQVKFSLFCSNNITITFFIRNFFSFFRIHIKINWQIL